MLFSDAKPAPKDAPGPVVPKPDPDAPRQPLAAVPLAKRRSPLPRSPPGAATAAAAASARPPPPWQRQTSPPAAGPPIRKRPFDSTQDGERQKGQGQKQQEQPAKKQLTAAPDLWPPRTWYGSGGPPQRNQGQGQGQGGGGGGGGNNKWARKRGGRRNNKPVAQVQNPAPVPAPAPAPAQAPAQAPVQAPAPLNNPFSVVRSQPGASPVQPLVRANPFAASMALQPQQQQQLQQFQLQQFQQQQLQQQLLQQQQQPPQHNHYHNHAYYICDNMQLMFADARGAGPGGRGGVVQISGGTVEDVQVREITEVTMVDEGGLGHGQGAGQGTELAKGWGHRGQ